MQSPSIFLPHSKHKTHGQIIILGSHSHLAKSGKLIINRAESLSLIISLGWQFISQPQRTSGHSHAESADQYRSSLADIFIVQLLIKRQPEEGAAIRIRGGNVETEEKNRILICIWIFCLLCPPVAIITCDYLNIHIFLSLSLPSSLFSIWAMIMIIQTVVNGVSSTIRSEDVPISESVPREENGFQ